MKKFVVLVLTAAAGVQAVEGAFKWSCASACVRPDSYKVKFATSHAETAEEGFRKLVELCADGTLLSTVSGSEFPKLKDVCVKE